jgi:hypothetical protein
MGLLAGYAVICIIDPKYDFLHVMFEKQQELGPGAGNIPVIDAEIPKARPDLPPMRAKTSISPESRHRNLPAARESLGENRQDGLPSEAELDSTRPFQRRPALQMPNRLGPAIPSVLPLPSLNSTSKPSMLTALPIGDDSSSVQETVDLSLTQGSNIAAGRLSLVAEGDAKNQDKIWVVHWTPVATDLQGVGGFESTDVGRFCLIKNILCFAWATDVAKPAVSALRNSLLQLRLGNAQHDAALRTPENLDGLSIDLTKQKLSVVFICEDMPELENIRIDVSDTSMLPAHRVDGAGLRGLKVSDVTTLWYYQADGAATRLTVKEHGNHPAIEVETRYRLPSGFEEALTIRRGNRKLLDLREDLATASAYRATAKNRSPGLDKKIAELETDLRALEQIANLARHWHEKTKLPLRFYIIVDDYEIELAKTN